MAHRFERHHREQYDDGWGTWDQEATEEVLAPATQIMEEQAGRILSLPIHQYLTEGEIQRVADTVNGFFR